MKLHEKKISELEITEMWDNGYLVIPLNKKKSIKGEYPNYINFQELKKWAIAIVKDITKEPLTKFEDRVLYNFLIDKFELTEDDLK